jgi:phospholipid/cholesterol/gamma-HCH transport system ATP-binding protein
MTHPTPPHSQPPASPPEARIRCEGLQKRFGRAVALSDITLSVAPGQMLGLIGPGAAGKSLIVKIICGLIKPDAGRAFIDGVEVTSLKEAQLQSLRARVGMVFQNYALFDFMNVGDNIALPLRMQGGISDSEIRDRVAEILQKVALPGIEHKLPSELSGGMKKRVSFARAVIRKPPIVIYDDPTAGLDPVTSAKIFALLQDMQAAGTTSITISHDLDGIRPLCDAWALIDHGRLVFQGSTAAFEASEHPLARAFWRG